MLREKLTKSVLGREESLFQADFFSVREDVISKLKSSKVMITGAAGSIGSAFTKLIAEYPLSSLHLVDLSENNLVETVRELRSRSGALTAELRTFAIGMGSPEFRYYLEREGPFDYILNFAAMKHVRSERDPYSLMRLLQVNVVANDDLLSSLQNASPKKVFAVSSDKAVNSANLMGGSKAFMERVFLSRSEDFHFNSARFANVAFSDGSLLDGFLKRLDRRQPFSAPTDIRRFFIDEREAAQLCLLSLTTGKSGEIYYPNLHPDKDLKSFSDIACLILDEMGLKPVHCESEEEARTWFGRFPNQTKEWPCYFTASNTSGEKPYEEFVNDGEITDTDRFSTLGVVTQPATTPPDMIQKVLAEIRRLYITGNWSKSDLVNLVQEAVPEMKHIETHQNLDQKM